MVAELFMLIFEGHFPCRTYCASCLYLSRTTYCRAGIALTTLERTSLRRLALVLALLSSGVLDEAVVVAAVVLPVNLCRTALTMEDAMTAAQTKDRRERPVVKVGYLRLP